METKDIYNIEQNTLKDEKVNNLISYLKEVAEVVSLTTDTGNKILVQEYEKMNYISNKTVLCNYLYKQVTDVKNTTKYKQLIFPFGLNKSQMEAVYNAMNSKISIIQGPPGTGKTQTILNIIANIIMRNQTVAVVSNNNAATDNIYEKLKSYNLDFLCARLGKKENIERFVAEQTGEYPKFSERLDLDERFRLEREILLLNETLPKMYEIENEIKNLEQNLKELQLEQKYFETYEKDKIKTNLKLKNSSLVTSDDILKLKVEYDDKQKATLRFILKSCIHYGIGSFQNYLMRKDDLGLYYARLFYVLKEAEIKKEINQKKLQKLEFDFKKKIKLLMTYSQLLLLDRITDKYEGKKVRIIYKESEISKTRFNFNYEYPVILSTTYSVKKCINAEHIYDYIIIDEASQVDLLTGVLALSCARNIIVVGDTKQLPNIIKSYDKKIIEQITKKYNITDEYNYNNSFLESIEKALPEIPRTLLQEHYRCHPKIIEFCNKKFYDNKLVICTEDNNEKDVLKVYRTPPGNHARGHLNQRQIDIITNEILPKLLDKERKEAIGIISPYREQRDMLLKEDICQGIAIDTVHKFQGREKDVIIITTVDNEISNFVDNINMINVAISRAKKQLQIIVPHEKQAVNSNISDFIKYVEYNNFDVLNSNVKSIFDLLYKANYKKRQEYLKTNNKKTELQYNSEKLTYKLLRDILSLTEYHSLDIAVHVPLQQIVTIDDSLTKREREYIKNINTHIDFVIYSKMDKKTVLVIETDGYKYHKMGTKQYERDQIKDKILKNYGIELLRLNTTGSNEELRIKEKLNEILNI